MQTTWSTPLCLKAGASSLKRGRWVLEQVGVKAPGSENTATVRPLKSASEVISFHSRLTPP
jgi:hypothetical protein